MSKKQEDKNQTDKILEDITIGYEPKPIEEQIQQENQANKLVNDAAVSILEVNLIPDYSLAIYPMHVLSTNRILDTIISRHHNVAKTRIVQDFKDIHRLQGFRGYLFGLTPYMTNFLFNHLEIFGNSDEEWNHETGWYWFILTIGVWNPLNIMIVRMQCLDYPHRKFRNALKDMIMHDKHRMFYRGLTPVFMGQVYLYLSMSAAEYVDQNNVPYSPALCLGLFLMGALAAQPFYVVGMRVQYGRFHNELLQRQAYNNWLTAVTYIKQTKGMKGFWAGFVPSLFIYGATYFEQLKRSTWDRLLGIDGGDMGI